MKPKAHGANVLNPDTCSRRQEAVASGQAFRQGDSFLFGFAYARLR